MPGLFIFHLLSDVFEFVDSSGAPVRVKGINHGRNFSTKCPDAPPNKYYKARAIGAIILDSTKKSIDLASICMALATEGKFQFLFSYPEILLGNQNKTILKMAKFQKNVRFVVVDEAHLMNEC